MTYARKLLIALILLILTPLSYASDNDPLFDRCNVLAPTVGPVLGKLNNGNMNFWLRGPVLDQIATDTHYFGVIQIKRSSDLEWPQQLAFFPLSVPYDADGAKEKKDYVGLYQTALTPGTYDYRCGYFGCNKEEPGLLTKYTWTDQQYTFRVRDKEKEVASLAFGSCRYFAKILCWYPWLNTSDKIFEHVLNNKFNIDAFAVIGDYIYGDYFNFMGQSQTYSQFMTLYEKAMNTRYFKELIASVPCLTILDDHEVSNNFGAEYPQANPAIYDAGMRTYMTYQHMVTPGYKDNINLNHLGYPFMIGNVPGFMMNARSNRNVSPPRIIAAEEMVMVKNWLSASDKSPFKVLMTSVPIFPIYANNPGQDDDKWFAFKDQMMELLGYIDEQKISGVIICSGDIHKSLYAQIKTPQGITITTVIASPFFSPYGHDEGPNSELQTEKDIPEFVPGYPFISSSQIYHTDAYAKLDFYEHQTLGIRLYDSNGICISAHDPVGTKFVLCKPYSYNWD